MLTLKHKEIDFGVGDQIRVTQKILEGGKQRLSIFTGQVIGIKGRSPAINFTVRRLGEAGVAIEKIYPVASPTIEKVELLKKGTQGVRHAKLYYTREKSAKQIDTIYSRAALRNVVNPSKPKAKNALKKGK